MDGRAADLWLLESANGVAHYVSSGVSSSNGSETVESIVRFSLVAKEKPETSELKTVAHPLLINCRNGTWELDGGANAATLSEIGRWLEDFSRGSKRWQAYLALACTNKAGERLARRNFSNSIPQKLFGAFKGISPATPFSALLKSLPLECEMKKRGTRQASGPFVHVWRGDEQRCWVKEDRLPQTQLGTVGAVPVASAELVFCNGRLEQLILELGGPSPAESFPLAMIESGRFPSFLRLRTGNSNSLGGAVAATWQFSDWWPFSLHIERSATTLWIWSKGVESCVTELVPTKDLN